MTIIDGRAFFEAQLAYTGMSETIEDAIPGIDAEETKRLADNIWQQLHLPMKRSEFPKNHR